MNPADRIVPFVAVSFFLHLIGGFWYAHAFQSKARPFPKQASYYKVNLVEVPRKKPVEKIVPSREARPTKPPEKKKVRLPEKKRPRKEEKKREKPAKKKEPEKAVPPAPRPLLVNEREKEAAPSPGAPVTVETENFPFAYYLSLIENRVGSRWNPPKGLVMTKPSVTVHFEIHRDGRIFAPAVVSSSGRPFFDLSAMRAVTDSNPFPPLPDGFEGNALAVNFIFHYEG